METLIDSNIKLIKLVIFLWFMLLMTAALLTLGFHLVESFTKFHVSFFNAAGLVIIVRAVRVMLQSWERDNQ